MVVPDQGELARRARRRRPRSRREAASRGLVSGRLPGHRHDGAAARPSSSTREDGGQRGHRTADGDRIRRPPPAATSSGRGASAGVETAEVQPTEGMRIPCHRAPRERRHADPPTATDIEENQDPMPAMVLIGAQWGDEGKGKATDLLGERVHWVVRYQGGNNAGHTVVLPDGAEVRAAPDPVGDPHPGRAPTSSATGW